MHMFCSLLIGLPKEVLFDRKHVCQSSHLGSKAYCFVKCIHSKFTFTDQLNAA